MREKACFRNKKILFTVGIYIAVYCGIISTFFSYIIALRLNDNKMLVKVIPCQTGSIKNWTVTMRIEDASEIHKSPIQNIANFNQPRIKSGYTLGTCLIVIRLLLTGFVTAQCQLYSQILGVNKQGLMALLESLLFELSNTFQI